MLFRALFFALTAILVASPLAAANTDKAAANTDNPAIGSDVPKKLEAALRALGPTIGSFEQRSGNGDTLRGRFQMDLPERLRFAYTHGSQAIVTVSGRFIAVQDGPGGEANRFPVSATPLKFFREAHSKGVDAALIAAADDTTKALSVTLRDPKNKSGGQITLYFAKPDMRLTAWHIIDAQNQQTTIVLGEMERLDSLPASTFFVLEDEWE